MAVQLSVDRCGVVLVGPSQGGTAPGPQSEEGPTNATDCGSDPLLMAGEGQSRATGHQTLRIVHWNAEGVWEKETWSLTVPPNAKHRRLLHPGDPSQQHAQILHPGIWSTSSWPSRQTQWWSAYTCQNQHNIHRGPDIRESWHGIHHREAHSPRQKPDHI